MVQITVEEARQRLPELLDAVEATKAGERRGWAMPTGRGLDGWASREPAHQIWARPEQILRR